MGMDKCSVSEPFNCAISHLQLLPTFKNPNKNPYHKTGGFIAGVPCTQDSDCSAAGSGLWCKGGAWNKLGKCEACPSKCNGGCHAW